MSLSEILFCLYFQFSSKTFDEKMSECHYISYKISNQVGFLFKCQYLNFKQKIDEKIFMSETIDNI